MGRSDRDFPTRHEDRMRLIVPLFALACGGSITDGVTDTEPEITPLPETSDEDSADQDAPAESNPDGDAVPGEDADAIDALGALTGIEIEVTYETWRDDALVCAKEVAVTGTPYTGECEGCAFAFDIEGTLVEDNSESDCYVSDYRMLRTDGAVGSMVLAYAELLEVDRWGEINTYADAVFVTYSSTGYMGYGGTYEYTRVLSHAEGGDDPGVFRLDGTDFVWGGDFETSVNGEDQLVSYCGTGTSSTWTGDEPTGISSAREEVSCDAKQVDLWEITVDETQTVDIAVDTVSADTTFDPRVMVMNTEGCVVGSADDSFECSYPPPAYSCPAVSMELEPGTYTILVTSFIDGCVDGVDEGEYKLRVDSETPIRPTLVEDDIYRYEQIPTATDYRAAGTLLTE